jgi:membrane protein
VSDSGGIGGLVTSVLEWADATQRKHSVLGFPYAVIKKFGDDEGGRHAALLTYYGFLSIFPFLLLVVVMLSAVLQGNAELRTQVIDAIVPPQFRETVDTALLALPSGGVPLLVGVAGLIFAGLGIVFSAYETLNHVATIPHRRRMEFFPRYLRVIAMLLLLIVGVAGIGVLTVAVSGLGDLPGLSRLAAYAGTAAITFLLLWASTGLLLPIRARFLAVWPAALVGSLAVAGVITFGALVLPRLIQRSGAVYGSFATIVGFLGLIYVVALVLVYAAEVAVVRRRRLWPRSLDLIKPAEADRRSLLLLAREQERIRVERVDAVFDADPS